jgi:acyl-CoA thioester hydrolase
LVKDQHIRFLKEARPGAALHMTGGVLEMSDTEARVLLLMVHSGSGELAASIQSVVSHVTTREERAFPWSPDVRARAAALSIAVPERAAPRSLAIDTAPGVADLAAADRMGLVRLSAGAIGAQDCDAFGRMRPELFIGRVSDGVPAMAAAFRAGGEAAERPAGVGGAVIEYRLIHHAWPRAGDRFEVRSGLAGADARTQKVVHWMLDPVSGKAWGTAEAIAVALDLTARKMIPNSEADLERLRARITPGLTL